MTFRSLFLATVLACAMPFLPPLLASAQTPSVPDGLPFSAGQPDIPFLIPSQGSSATPALRLLYTANTRGALFPCPT